MKKNLNNSFVFTALSNRTLLMISGLVFVGTFSGCKSVDTKNASPIANPQAQERSKHQADHGATAGHRALFIDEYDLDGDGVVTRVEFDQARIKKLKDMDSNNDGLVSEPEYLDHFASELEKKISGERKEQILQTEIRFKSIDTNNDGKMMWDEYWASGMRTFVHFAKTENGVVTLKSQDKEWDAEPEKGKKQSQDKNEKPKDKNEQSDNEIVRPATLNMPSSHSLEGFIEINDLNGDQQVTAEEFRQVRRNIFDSTDTNKDGWINPEEYTLEFTNRLDRQAKQVRAAQMSQARVRFGVLNTDKDEGISQQEFAASGNRIFTGWDLNDDGKVSAADPLPQIKKEGSTDNASAKPAGQ